MQNELFSLEGKHILIVGASSGIGAHAAKLYSERGAKLYLAARRTDELDKMVKKLHAKSFFVDVQDIDSIENLVSKIDKIDVLLNTAGMNIRKPAISYTPSEWDQLMNINLKGTWLTSQAVIKHMLIHKTQGSIIHLSSFYGKLSHADHCLYTTSKAGLEQMTRSLALECAQYQIRVNAIAPGYIETPLTKEHLKQFGQYVKERTPLHRIGCLDDLNGVLLLLSSQASSYITGSIIPVDGGISVYQF
jgi:NAD(P)-dependent dehydrogenase (short-subunit alcohol dehydrogenase family)